MEVTIHALKVEGRGNDVYQGLLEGEGRFGWSYVKTADLRTLKARMISDGWSSLSPEEQNCYQSFLLEMKSGDWVVYINTPSWGRCTAAQVTSEYFWRWADDDFNHRFQVNPETVCEFDRNDALVHPALSARLKLQGRQWKISTKHEFILLVDAVRAGQGGVATAPEHGLRRLAEEARPSLLEITRRIHRTHPNYALEIFFARVLANVPEVVDVHCQGGAGDHGADILVTLERLHPLTSRVEQSLCLVQVKSFEGDHGNTGAVDDLRRAFNRYTDASMGLIVSTADRPTPDFEAAVEQLRQDTRKEVSILIGPELALFVLRHASDVFDV